VPNFTRKTTHNYSAKENDWGYSCFMTWSDILDENQGYIKDDKVILEVYVKADPPKNVLYVVYFYCSNILLFYFLFCSTHGGFLKKIEDYMRLADLQSSRGLIDKALEVNASALKFCKEKDDASKKRLDDQRSRLNDFKLKQTIERIEKGMCGCGCGCVFYVYPYNYTGKPNTDGSGDVEEPRDSTNMHNELKRALLNNPAGRYLFLIHFCFNKLF
jgi:hypothetical protein